MRQQAEEWQNLSILAQGAVAPTLMATVCKYEQSSHSIQPVSGIYGRTLKVNTGRAPISTRMGVNTTLVNWIPKNCMAIGHQVLVVARVTSMKHSATGMSMG